MRTKVRPLSPIRRIVPIDAPGLTLILLLFGFGALLAGCDPGYQGEKIAFRSPARESTAALAAPSERQNVIRMAVAPVLSPRETFGNQYRELLQYLGDKLKSQTELVQGKTYSEVNSLLQTGDLTLALVSTNPYLQGQMDFGMEALVTPEIDGSLSYYSYLIVRAEAPFRSFDDLRGASFAFSDPLSNSGWLVPVYQLALRDHTPESFFRRTIFTHAHDNAIRAVARKLVDAAAVESLVYDYWMQRGSDYTSETKVIERWGPFGIPPVVVHPKLDSTLKRKLRDTLLGMHQEQNGREILRPLAIDRFVVATDSIYDSVRVMRTFLASGRRGR